MELKDTVDLMLSDDWKDRLKAEYLQCVIRLNGLQKVFDSGQFGKFEKMALESQLSAMRGYCGILASRCLRAGIDTSFCQPRQNGV